MSKHLVSAANPEGQRTEDLLAEIRAEVPTRMAAYGEDPRPEAKTVLENNLEIAQLLTDAIHLGEVNTKTLAEDI